MRLQKRDYDAIVIGSGPNGLASAILLQQKGLSVLLIEGKETIGGGLRTAELTLPGFLHDICSAVHPLAVSSPFFETLPLSNHGLEYIYPKIAAAHPFDDGTAAHLQTEIGLTSDSLGKDEASYQKLITPLVNSWPLIKQDVLGLLHFPHHLPEMANFGLKALSSASHLSKSLKSPQASAFFVGMAAHSMQPLTKLTTAAAGLVLLIAGHTNGWPIPKGGSQQIANALAGYFHSIGGEIQTNFFVSNLSQLPSAHAILFDTTPKQLLQIAGHQLSTIYKWQLKRYRYGMGVFKVDWALSEPIPFTNKNCRQAGTLHLGNSIKEIIANEQQTWEGGHPEKPFVLLSQPSIFDKSRAPINKHTAWAYCHVPNGSEKDMTTQIENQVERFAPGFKDVILARHTFNTSQMQAYNPNYIGGDINGGVLDIGQLFTRPALRLSPYQTSKKGLYLCSASTPPGGGVHGMCGYHAAKRALKDVFNTQ